MYKSQTDMIIVLKQRYDLPSYSDLSFWNIDTSRSRMRNMFFTYFLHNKHVKK